MRRPGSGTLRELRWHVQPARAWPILAAIALVALLLLGIRAQPSGKQTKTMPLTPGQTIGIADGAQTQTVAATGAPVEANRQMDVSITNTTETAIASFTVPATYGAYANVPVRCSVVFNIGAGNTNNGIITIKAYYTDPFTNSALAIPLAIYESPVQALNGITLTKGGGQYNTVPLVPETKPSTGVIVKYQNTATGTIGDTVSVIIELL